MLRTMNMMSLMCLAVLLACMLPDSATGGDIPEESRIGGFALGPQAWSFHQFTFYEAVDKAKETGCRVMEAYPGQKLSPSDDVEFIHNADPSVWSKAKRKLESAGIRLVNYGVCDFQNETEAYRIFDFAKIMDIPVVTMEPIKADKESFDLLEKLVREYDIKVAIHNHPKGGDALYWDPNFVLQLIQNRDTRIGACADVGHWIRSGIKPLEGMRILKGRIHSMHLKDLNDFARRAHDVPYGTGISDITAILNELKAQGFNGNIAIEYERNWENNVPEIKQCVDFVRAYGKKNP